MKIKKSSFDLLALFISVVLTISLYIKIDVLNYSHKHFQNFWDHHKYIWMAVNNLDFHIAPFCWRIFVPLLASLLPFEISINFKIISLLSIILTGFFVFKIGEKIFNERILSFAMMFGYFSISYASKYVIYDFWLPDAFAILLITLGIYFILLKNDFAFLIVMTIGAMTKESVLFVLPLYYSINANKLIDIKVLKKTLILSLIPFLVFVFIRIIIQPFNSNVEYVQSLPPQLRIVQIETSDYNLKFLIEKIALKKIENFNLYTLYRITLYTFLIHFLLAFFDFKLIKEWLLRYFPFLVLVYLQIFFAENEERLVSIAFIPILILSISGLNKIFLKTRYRYFSIIIFSVIVFIMVLEAGLFYGDWLIIRQVLLLIVLYFLSYVISKINFSDIKNSDRNS